MRSRNMQALTDDVREEYPGVVIYGIGDAAHQLSPSDHNEDDTPGSNPEQFDADNVPEHRAIDVMLGPNFSSYDASSLVSRVVSSPSARPRLHYVIWNRRIWTRENGWVGEYFDGDPHDDHIHFSGWAPDDENGASWPEVHGDVSLPPNSLTGEDDMFFFVQRENFPAIYLSNGLVQRWVRNEKDFANLRLQAHNGTMKIWANGDQNVIVTSLEELVAWGVVLGDSPDFPASAKEDKPVTLTEEDRTAVATAVYDAVNEQVEGLKTKLDNVLTRLAKAGDALDG